MRIISGSARGIRLRAPSGDAVRPTTDRVKESVFGSLGALGSLDGAVIADLFSGSGSLGLEALSRGAGKVLFVERDRTALRVLKENLTAVIKAAGNGVGTATIAPLDVARVPALLSEWAGRLDVIFADPPYRPRSRDYGAASLLLDATFSTWADGALLVLEHAAENALPWHPEGLWCLERTRRFGSVAVSWARPPTSFSAVPRLHA